MAFCSTRLFVLGIWEICLFPHVFFRLLVLFLEVDLAESVKSHASSSWDRPDLISADLSLI